MPAIDDMPTITGYTIHGAAGRLSRGDLTNRDVQATAWAALGAVTAARWERLELRQRRPGVFEVEGRNGAADRSGVYLLTLGDTPSHASAHRPAERHLHLTTPPARQLTSDTVEDVSTSARRPGTRRMSWVERLPAAPAVLTRSELTTAVNTALGTPISASAIMAWDRDEMLPIPLGDPATRRYPEAAHQVILRLIALEHTDRTDPEILALLRGTVEDLNADAAPALAHTKGG